MKNYTSLGSSPNTNYIRFNNNGLGGAGGAGGGLGGGGLGGGGLGGWGDNLVFNRLAKHEMQETQETLETLEKREINRKSEGVNVNQNLYTTENIIHINNNKNNSNSGNLNNSASFIPGEVVYRKIIIPFYVCLMDIIILNDLFIEIVDNGNDEMKNKIIGSGKIRKFRLNGAIKNYDIFVEMENENVYHIKKRGIMMRVDVPEDVRKLIINTMVNYVADGGDVDTKQKAVGVIISDGSGGGGGGGGGGGDSRERIIERNRSGRGGLGCFGCFKSHPD